MILKNPEANLTIAQLGHKVFLNEQKLKTGFHLCYHTTIGAFIKDCRMARASELLVHTSATIEEIARTCGTAAAPALYGPSAKIPDNAPALPPGKTVRVNFFRS